MNILKQGWNKFVDGTSMILNFGKDILFKAGTLLYEGITLPKRLFWDSSPVKKEETLLDKATGYLHAAKDGMVNKYIQDSTDSGQILDYFKFK